MQEFNANAPIKTEEGKTTMVLVKAPDGYVNDSDETPNPKKDRKIILTIGSVDSTELSIGYVKNKLDENIKILLIKCNRSKEYIETRGAAKMPHTNVEFTLCEIMADGSFAVSEQITDSEYGKHLK